VRVASPAALPAGAGAGEGTGLGFAFPTWRIAPCRHSACLGCRRAGGPVKVVLLHLGWWGMREKGGSGRASSNKLGGVGSRADLEALSPFLRRHCDGRKRIDRSLSMLLAF
jgi:hypothetical protein